MEICICRWFGGQSPPPNATELMEIGVEKSMEARNFCIILMEPMPFLNFLKEFYRIFGGNCVDNLGKYGQMNLEGVRGRSPPSLKNF